MTLVHALAAGYLLAFVGLLAYLFQHTRKLARLARQVEALEQPEPSEHRRKQAAAREAAPAPGS